MFPSRRQLEDTRQHIDLTQYYGHVGFCRNGGDGLNLEVDMQLPADFDEPVYPLEAVADGRTND